jgi:uncharacterized protein YcfJ
VLGHSITGGSVGAIVVAAVVGDRVGDGVSDRVGTFVGAAVVGDGVEGEIPMTLLRRREAETTRNLYDLTECLLCTCQSQLSGKTQANLQLQGSSKLDE